MDLFSDKFTNPKVLIQIVMEYISYFSSPFGHVTETDTLLGLESLPNIKDFEDIDEIRKFFQEHGQDLKVFFTVPKQQILSNLTPTLNPNEVIATFINFLLLMVEVILRFEEDSIACVKVSIQNLRTELGFLISFLGDTAMHLQPTKNILIDIEAVVNEVGSFLHSFLLTIVVFFLISKEMKPILELMPDLEVLVNEVRSLFHSNSIHFLEDIPLLNGRKETEKQEKKETIDIKALLHEIGSLLDLALSDLLAKFETLKSKIKEHCITVSKMPSDMAPKTRVVSLFIVDSVLDDLTDLINNKSEGIVVVNDQIVKVHNELMSLGSSIAEIALQHEEEHEELVIRSRDVAYEVEYVIKSIPHVWYLSLRLPQLIEKIQHIKMAVEEMKNNIYAARMSQVTKYPTQSKEAQILEDIVVGFDKVAIEITEQLVRGTKQLQIISIFGMPGLGKTTLANKLYNDPSVLHHFYKHAWCIISQTYNKKNVLIEILCSLSGNKRDTYMKMEEESLAEKLYKSLKGRRYLIVIDDIWDINVWNDLKRYFPDDGIESRILFTTRNKEVGLNASHRSVINELPFLSEVECWEILEKKVFGDKKCPQELLDIGKQIATNCHGLPLAVVVIAGVLANMEKEKYLWQKVAGNLSSHIFEKPDNCIQILQLSYKHLPMHLKPCFLYFGAFKEDEEIPVWKLISLWVAEGYIKKEEKKNIEDVALEYLMKLIDRSLVLVGKRRADGRVKTCKIHDLLREMCLRIAQENNFLKVVKLNDELRFFSQVSTYQQHHCLSINCAKSPICSLPFGLHIRSLKCECDFVHSTTLISCSYKVLRVLDFNRTLIGFEHLVHLRYLAISRTLPPMESFHKLEFLVVDSDEEVEIPEILLKMASLRHMQFKGCAYFSESCRQLATISESFQINNNLESISELSIYDERDKKILKCSPNLRRLNCWVENSRNHSFEFLNQLESLKISTKYDPDCWCSILISLPLNLKKLTLVAVHLSRKQMEIIGRLPYLEVLKLVYVFFEGEQWDTSEGEFPQLKYLKFDGVKIAEWNASGDNFPILEQIVLEDCENLKMIPSSLGDIPTLQMIQVYRCAQTTNESAMKIQEEQQEMGNEVLEVRISGTFGDYEALFRQNFQMLREEIGPTDLATHIGEVVINKGFSIWRDPISRSAAAMYLACRLEDKRITEAEICMMTGITEVTLREVYSEMWENLKDLLPLNYKEKHSEVKYAKPSDI